MNKLGDVSTILSADTSLLSHTHNKSPSKQHQAAANEEIGLYSSYTRPLLGKDRYLDAFQHVSKLSI